MSERLVKYRTCKRWNEPGDAHELTFTCFHRYPLLARNRTRVWLCKSIDRARERHALDLWAYVIMPEHVHLLIRPRPREYSISRVLRAIKWPLAIQAKRFLMAIGSTWLERLTDRQPSGRSSFRFWQRGGGYDRNINRDKTLANMIDYIHANPVRRGLSRSRAIGNGPARAGTPGDPPAQSESMI